MARNTFDKSEYGDWIKSIKDKIRSAKNKAALSVNQQLIQLYWELGKDITFKMKDSNWGSKVIEQISIDLNNEFPDMKGFSKRNLYAVRQWYLFYSQRFEFVPQSVAQLPWGHNRLIITKIKDVEKALFYSIETVKNGWPRDILEVQIDDNLIERVGGTSNNFESTLPVPYSKMAGQTLKDPYNFDFLGLENEAKEREIENEISRNITDFLLELGKGFAFVGRQYPLEVGQNEYFLDLLFYHLDLRSYVVLELKSGKFKPEYAGKLNFYLSAVDSILKKESDNPTIGILLCKKKDKIEAEYALRDINKPMGISEYKLTEAIPENIKTKLPTIEELEEDLKMRIKNKDNWK
ncbi:Predicted nuclease of restriction endonuclease-like (RecB) superfamily, DUF1016 family [Pricia antarctica]|uniref:Predicted nuclease of restriction endonuclease-like (RecB) superfamily, DUF1016 family n=1 Tax=Pricia antarctica TaxID=641691 RepID=A0A1G6VNV1_9FLAO|nr:PDDEXK nuclease domain-containing protein [Pricia antarctica]SDD55278.1 Predicted nuclease of restriction endonuclease-like (RecB) superfamily, DUF1016 family [Pricia antarctica]